MMDTNFVRSKVIPRNRRTALCTGKVDHRQSEIHAPRTDRTEAPCPSA
jgi:hypothetical protein